MTEARANFAIPPAGASQIPVDVRGVHKEPQSDEKSCRKRRQQEIRPAGPAPAQQYGRRQQGEGAYGEEQNTRRSVADAARQGEAAQQQPHLFPGEGHIVHIRTSFLWNYCFTIIMRIE